MQQLEETMTELDDGTPTLCVLHNVSFLTYHEQGWYVEARPTDHTSDDWMPIRQSLVKEAFAFGENFQMNQIMISLSFVIVY